MSIEAINRISKMDIKPSGRKFVALALANFADDEGVCFPTIKQISAWTGQGDKTVRDHLDALETDGIMTRKRQRREDGTLGRYRFFIQRRISPVEGLTSGENYRYPAADFAAQETPTKPSLKKISNDIQKTPRKILETVLRPEIAKAVIDHRRTLRSPLTERAAELLAKKFQIFADPNLAADTMIERGWKSIEPDYSGVPPLKGAPKISGSQYRNNEEYEPPKTPEDLAKLKEKFARARAKAGTAS